MCARLHASFHWYSFLPTKRWPSTYHLLPAVRDRPIHLSCLGAEQPHSSHVLYYVPKILFFLLCFQSLPQLNPLFPDIVLSYMYCVYCFCYFSLIYHVTRLLSRKNVNKYLYLCGQMSWAGCLVTYLPTRGFPHPPPPAEHSHPAGPAKY